MGKNRFKHGSSWHRRNIIFNLRTTAVINSLLNREVVIFLLQIWILILKKRLLRWLKLSSEILILKAVCVVCGSR